MCLFFNTGASADQFSSVCRMPHSSRDIDIPILPPEHQTKEKPKMRPYLSPEMRFPRPIIYLYSLDISSLMLMFDRAHKMSSIISSKRTDYSQSCLQ